MNYLTIIGLVTCVIYVSAADVQKAFEDARIVPEVIDVAPAEKIQVKYGSKEVDLGNDFTPMETQNIPEIHYKHEGGVLYTLIMTDPDVPIPKRKGYNREFKHWVVGNIPEENVAKGEVLAEYVGPAPPIFSGKHRYVFLVYKQNQGSITFDERRLSNRDGLLRLRFNVKKFAEKYNLEGPIAGNFLRAEYDDNVPTFSKLLGF
ncbi:protein D2-like [Ceratina calcarata]|uniref:Protein D2-like n=1 Tax=Ceratina calcarata TaxID=156304 RepID=A0AAJ7JCZ7_9HYME|nr:protein D2-like [Ceratina calcarata]